MAAAPFLALADLLGDLAGLLVRVTPEAYVARPAPGISGAVGEQVRHTLDHVAALLTADTRDTLSYDRRRRGTMVETEPTVALDETLRLKAMAERHTAPSLDEPVFVASKVSASGGEVEGWSTIGRELAFVVAHTIHHEAIIALLLALQGIQVPPRFGYAPSTPVAPPVKLHAA